MNLFKTDQIHFHHVRCSPILSQNFAGTYFRGRPILKNFAGTYFRGFEQNRENREN